MSGNQTVDSASGVTRDRRQLLTVAATGIAAAVAAGTLIATSAVAQSASAIRGPLRYAAMRSEPGPRPVVATQNAASATRSNTMLRRSTARASTT